VPAYLGQLTVVAVVGGSDRSPSRWLAVRHAIAYVLGFGAVFTLLGVTATFVGGPLADYLPVLRTVGGLLLVVLGLNLAGFLPIPALDRTWRPLEAGAAGAMAQRTGTVAFASAGVEGGPGLGQRLGGRLVGGRGGVLASFGLGVVFAVGWTPCIGIILGSILTVAASSGTTLQGGVLLAAYTLGPRRAVRPPRRDLRPRPALVRPLVRQGGREPRGGSSSRSSASSWSWTG